MTRLGVMNAALVRVLLCMMVEPLGAIVQGLRQSECWDCQNQDKDRCNSYKSHFLLPFAAPRLRTGVDQP
jgi:hypothetical protein